MTTVDTVLPATRARTPTPRPSLAMAVLTAGLLLCAAGYAAVALLIVRVAVSLAG